LGINAYYGTIFSPLKTDGTPLWERLHIMIKGDDGTFGHVNVRFNSATSITIEIPTDQYLPADRLYIYTR
jgi:hypothetical protein